MAWLDPAVGRFSRCLETARSLGGDDAGASGLAVAQQAAIFDWLQTMWVQVVTVGFGVAPGLVALFLLLQAHKEAGGAVLEFTAAGGDENLQGRMGLLGDRPDDVLMEREVSLRLLRHIASSVRHQQFHDSDIVTVRVEVPETDHGR